MQYFRLNVVWKKDEKGSVGIKFNDKNIVYPFAKVSKQFENGLGDSIFSFYCIIPKLFVVKQKKNWWHF